MWVRLADKTFVDTDNGARMGVQSLPNSTYRVYMKHAQGASDTVSLGYETDEEAQGALDEFMQNATGFEQMQPPVTDEEKGK